MKRDKPLVSDRNQASTPHDPSAENSWYVRTYMVGDTRVTVTRDPVRRARLDALVRKILDGEESKSS